jgi:hypothetical protein
MNRRLSRDDSQIIFYCTILPSKCPHRFTVVAAFDLSVMAMVVCELLEALSYRVFRNAKHPLHNRCRHYEIICSFAHIGVSDF